MANGAQMKQAIEFAQKEVGGEGWRDADLRLVMLATTGYLAEKLEARSLFITGKKLLPAGLLIGSIIGGLIGRFV